MELLRQTIRQSIAPFTAPKNRLRRDRTGENFIFYALMRFIILVNIAEILRPEVVVSPGP